jgi:hypothetical protein
MRTRREVYRYPSGAAPIGVRIDPDDALLIELPETR